MSQQDVGRQLGQEDTKRSGTAVDAGVDCGTPQPTPCAEAAPQEPPKTKARRTGKRFLPEGQKAPQGACMETALDTGAVITHVVACVQTLFFRNRKPQCMHRCVLSETPARGLRNVWRSPPSKSTTSRAQGHSERMRRWRWQCRDVGVPSSDIIRLPGTGHNLSAERMPQPECRAWVRTSRTSVHPGPGIPCIDSDARRRLPSGRQGR